jgi:hypothetical protein
LNTRQDRHLRLYLVIGAEHFHVRPAEMPDRGGAG